MSRIFSYINVGDYIQDKAGFNILIVLFGLTGARATFGGARSMANLNTDLGLSSMYWTWRQVRVGHVRRRYQRAARRDVRHEEPRPSGKDQSGGPCAAGRGAPSN
ncbi:MAG: hypothetical protein ACOH2H_06555 [Cypionkella sp.]